MMQNENAVGANTTFDPNNPHGFGDPKDKRLRKVEVEVLIPKLIRERAKEIHCVKEVEEFSSCCKDNGLIMVVNCRKENSALRSCLLKWYYDEQFKEECKQIYLQERSEYRRTGIPVKHRKQ